MAHLAEPLIRRLRVSTPLAAEDIRALETLPMTIKTLPAQTVVVREGERPAQCCLMLEGFTCRSKTTDAGKRQILSIHIAGDIPDLQSLHLHVMDHDLTTLSKCVVGFIPHEALLALARTRPLIAEALWRETLIDAAVFREWIVNVGRRPAAKRLAHLIAELGTRLEAIGLSVDGHFELPMTQLDLADALGLTPVHLNRVLQELRHRNLLELRKHSVALRDVDELKKMGDFDELYLHQVRSS
ncbi:MAG TPA: Crp/Fnr family transcriptional regulator [Xanthobacteraceae bacterium]|nr:Crp/Fnr family transcriptional regulator [Xanthobacteraceae bacterium]